MNASSQGEAWVRQLAQRWRKHLLLKVVGTTIFMSVFFVGYFHLLRNPAYAVTQMPLTLLDRMVGFNPPALLAYVSLWFYVGIPPSLMANMRELVAYGFWVGGLCLVGLSCFYFWPTTVPAQTLDLTQYPAFSVLQGVDAAANACPSMHVATAAFSAIWVDRLLREVATPPIVRSLNWCWFVLIAYSTMAIKQHVALDVLAGLILGVLFAIPSLRLRPLETMPGRSA